MLCRLFKPPILLISAAGVLLAGLLLFSSPASALGIGVSPGKMEFSTRPGGTEVQTLHVINQSDRESKFQVYVEGEGAEWFEITPDEFTLGPKGVKDVAIELAPPLNTDPEDYDLFVCVASVSPGSNLRIGAGIKVPAHVDIQELPIMAVQWWVIGAILVVAFSVGISVRWRRRKQRKRKVIHA